MEKARHDVIEAAVSHDETLIEKYFRGIGADERGDSSRHSQLDRRRIHRARALRRRVQEQGRAGDARRGSRLPSVARRCAGRRRTLCRTASQASDVPGTTRRSAGLAFKIATDPFVGKLTFFRVYSGVLKSGSYVYNATKDKRERVGRLLQMHANKREEIEEVLRRRHCGGDRTQGHAHRRYDVRWKIRRSSSRR